MTAEFAPNLRSGHTPDSALAFQVPAAYQERNAYGCWHRDDGYWPTAADFCLRLGSNDVAAARREAWRVTCSGPSATSGDASCFDRAQEDTLTVGDQPALVVRALLSGTLGHYHRVPAVLVLIPFGSAGTAILEGTHRKPGTDAELLAIARTIRLFAAPSE